MRIVNNISAMNTHRVLSGIDNSLSKNLEKLSTGLRINRAADDAAGLAISEKMRNQISGLQQAIRNAQDGISLIQTAEGALNETHSILNRMRDLAVQAKNGTYTNEDREKLDKEFKALREEVGRIARDTEFNTLKLLSGQFASDGLKFQIGANKSQDITLTIKNMTSGGLGINDLALLSGTGATAANYDNVISKLDEAIKKVSEERANLGAIQNRLEHTINNLGVTAENLSASESRIRDVDMAQEMTKFTKNQILMHSATAMLAQANAKPQMVLSLLG
ncbi:MAG TPA: flagellin [Bacillota bacterium]|mgnify:CR=1 FL=1|nr:flagellin [Bacillota bacterium]